MAAEILRHEVLPRELLLVGEVVHALVVSKLDVRLGTEEKAR